MSANKEVIPMSIDERKVRILQAIISDYISTGEPVGSRTLAKKYDLGVSSATIRNEMSDLEEMGYLEQPHTSAGRIPSNLGYRLYVDSLMERQSLTLEEELLIKKFMLDSALYEVDKIIKQTSSLLSELTKLTCVVKAPSVKKSCITSIQLMVIDTTSLLCVIVTDSGIIKNNIIKLNNLPSMEVIQRINNVLNHKLKNRSIEEINLEIINSLSFEFQGYEEIFNALLPVLYDSLKNLDYNDVFMEGTTNIFNYPEYNDIDKAKEMLSLLYDKDNMTKLIETDKGITIKIGDENSVPEAKECSIISAEYSLGGKSAGTIGLIGPKRIDYSRIIAVMAEVMKELNIAIQNGQIR